MTLKTQLELLPNRINSLSQDRQHSDDTESWSTRNQMIQEWLSPLEFLVLVYEKLNDLNIDPAINVPGLSNCIENLEKLFADFESNPETIISGELPILFKSNMDGLSDKVRSQLIISWNKLIDKFLEEIPRDVLEILPDHTNYQNTKSGIFDISNKLGDLKNHLPTEDEQYLEPEILSSELGTLINDLPDFPEYVKEFMESIRLRKATYRMLTAEVSEWIKDNELEDSISLSWGTNYGTDQHSS